MSNLVIHFTDEQQRQIREATGRTIAGLSIDVTAAGHLSEADLQHVTGGTNVGSATSGAGAGKVQISEITVTKKTDSSSPSL